MTTRKNDSGATTWQMTLMGLRYLGGRRLRTTLTTLSIVFGVALIFAINLVLPSVLSAFTQTLSTISGSAITISSATSTSFEPDDVLPVVSAVEHVQAVTGILRREFSLPTLGSDNALGSTTQVEMIGIDPSSVEAVRQFPMAEGRFLAADDRGAVILPAGLAELAPEISVGTTFPLITAGGLRLYTIVGLVAEQGSLSTPQLYVTLNDAQDAFSQSGLINTVEVLVDPSADRDTVAAAIQQALGDGYLLDGVSNASDAFASVQIGLAAINLLGVIALFLGAFLIFNTFRTVVLERRHDLGMLRAIGATQRQIMLMIVIESLIQGVIGTAIGLVLGYLLSAGLMNGMKQLYTTYFHVASIDLQLNASAVIVAIVMGLSTALLAGFLPARAAGKTSPLEALRPATPASFHRAARWSLIAGVGLMVVAVILLLTGSNGAVGGALLFLIGMVVAAPGLVLPAARLFSPLLTLWFAREGDLARGNMIRQPGRAAITGSTLMIGLAVFVLMAALVTGFGGLMENLGNRNFSSDIILMPQSIGVYNNVLGADPSLAAQIRELPDVEAVGTLRYATSTSDGHALQVMGIDPNEYPQVASLEFNEGQPDEAFPALGNGRAAILTALSQSALGVELGDSFEMQTADGTQTYQVVGIANDLLTFKIAAIFISQTNMLTDFHKSEDVMVMINLHPDADETTALAAVQNIVNDYPQFTAHLTGQYRDQLIKNSSSVLGLFYMLALIILIPSALGLLNTLTINILERTREIGVVRAVGGSQSQVRRIVTGEALLLGIFGSAMGVLAGVAISYGFIGAFGSIGWTMPYIFPVAGIIAAVVIGILLALFASILPARSAAKLDIIRALQYE